MGIRLAEAYERCRLLHRHHGRSYYLATRLLPAWKRRHVHALYGFTRYADEIVDRPGVAERAERLAEWGELLAAGLRGEPIDDPLLPAVIHTIRVFDLPADDFAVFLRSMAMDLTIIDYPTFDSLLDYMAGSAAAIGTMMLPLLGSVDDAAAREPARQLGIAFQLTNFIRDIGEDLDRDRLYLPLEDLARFGVTLSDLRAAAASGEINPQIQALIRYEVQRARHHYALAEPGIALLQPSSRACVRSAQRLYAGILDEIVRADHNVFATRARVPTLRKWSLAGRVLLAEAVSR
ncbi:phytoene synthase [Longispora fulva]|nr:phytoene/squalene synthase family protein [Longispora fulva]GIG58157.1 phytoene synthase [Longispora fulva]